jgi:hypothetical protein
MVHLIGGGIVTLLTFQLVLSAPIIKAITTPGNHNHNNNGNGNGNSSGDAKDPERGPIILNAGSNGSVTQIANSNISNGYYPYRPYYPYYPSYYPAYYPMYWPFPPVNNNANDFFRPPKSDLKDILVQI